MVDQFGEIGGAQRCLLDLLSGWPADEARAIVAAPDHGPLLASVRGQGFETRALRGGEYEQGRKSAWNLLRFPLDVAGQRRTLSRILEEHSVDTVYVNGPRVLPAAALAAGGRRRLIFHAHNHLGHRYETTILRWALRRCPSEVIACCEYVAAALRGTVTTHVRVVPNGVPEIPFRMRSRVPGEAWRLGIVGRISPEKGHLELIEALRTITREGRRIRLSIHGTVMFSNTAYAEDVRGCAADLDVRFCGWTDDVGSALHQFDVLVVPSIAEPGLPRIVLEAFSAGTPVVAAPTGGIAEAVTDAQTGFLAPDATPSALALTLRRVMDLPADELRRVTRNARAAWQAQWNVDRWRREVLSAIYSGSATTSAPRLQASARVS